MRVMTETALTARSALTSLFVFSAFAACSDPSSAGRLELSLENAETAVVIDTGCAAACDRVPLGLSVMYPMETFPPQDTIDLLQYKIEYDLGDRVSAVPYFAGTTTLALKPGDTEPLQLTAAGAAQRSAVERAQGGQEITGNATVTVAGYDWDDRQVFVSLRFGVRFQPAMSSSSVDGGTSD